LSYYNLPDLFPHQKKQKYHKYFSDLGLSHGEKKEERLQSSKSSLLYKISQGQFGKKKSARGFCSRKAKLWLKPSLAKYIRNSIVFEPEKFLTGKGWTKRWRRERAHSDPKKRIPSGNCCWNTSNAHSEGHPSIRYIVSVT
jgi:adenine specific DNA methylase Mod